MTDTAYAQRLGEIIRTRRTAAGLTQTELAALIGVSKWSICQWERGLVEPAPSKYGKLIDTLGLTIAEIAEAGRI